MSTTGILSKIYHCLTSSCFQISQFQKPTHLQKITFEFTRSAGASQGEEGATPRMRAFAAVLLSASMLTTAATASTLSKPRARTIHAADSAAGPMLDLLSRDHRIIDIEDLKPSFVLSPIVIGPRGLKDQAIMEMVNEAYRAGLTVAIVGATQREANRFDGLVHGAQHASCRPAKRSRRMALYALQQTLRLAPPVDARYCLPQVPKLDRKNRKQSVRRWLRERFAALPPSPPRQKPVTPGFVSVNLDDLSAKIHCSEFVDNLQGQIQQDIFLTKLRSFAQEQDYYYVNSFAQFVPRVSDYVFRSSVSRPTAGTGFNDLIGTRLLFTEPSTITEAVSQYTNSRSTTVTAGGGFSSTKGFNVEASVSVTVGTATTITVPPVTIFNTANLGTAVPQWTFAPANPIRNVLFDTGMAFLWIVERDIYPDPNGGEEGTELFSFFDSLIGPPSGGTSFVTLEGTCEFPVPFPTWDVTDPEIDRVEPMDVRRGGGAFRILGAQMYPSLVSDVLLGGDPLNTANFVPIDDTEIQVVVPGGQPVGETPVQVNTLFNGQTLPSNNDVEVNILP